VQFRKDEAKQIPMNGMLEQLFQKFIAAGEKPLKRLDQVSTSRAPG
jgi:hypothetical protein